MKHADRISSVFFFLLGIAVLLKGLRFGLELNQTVGPGFFPFAAGIILCLLSFVLFIQPQMRPRPLAEKKFRINWAGWKRVLLTLLALGAYPVFINSLGFLLSTLFLLFFLFRAVARLKWQTVGVAGIIAAGGAYLIFEIWLKASLPRGFLGF
jgi:hypothetical protein